jgi:predicted esterase
MKRALVLLVAGACAKTPAPAPIVDSVDSGAPKPVVEPTPPPPPRAWNEDLDLAARPRAFVSVPEGPPQKRPVMIALHGSGDRPDWTCGAWRAVMKARPWIVCPRGAINVEWSTKDDQRYSHREPLPELAKHIDAALAALDAKHPGEVDLAEPILAGFSWGASQVIYLVTQTSRQYRRIGLVEGGYDVVISQRELLKKKGITHVLLGSGQAGNAQSAKHAVTLLERSGIGARAGHANVGHTFEVPLQKALGEHAAWWVEGDPRYE